MRLPSKAKKNPLFFAAMFCVLTASTLFAQNSGKVNLEPIEKWIEKHRDLRSLYVEFVEERKIKTLRKPTTTTGKMWMAGSGKLFRMETGSPPLSITLKNETGTTIINTKRKTAEIIGANGKSGSRVGKMEEIFQHLFPKSMADLQSSFDIVSVTKEGENWKAVLKPKRADTAKFLELFVLQISEDGDKLMGFSLYLKGDRVVSSRTTKTMQNPKVDSAVFSFSLKGYKVKR